MRFSRSNEEIEESEERASAALWATLSKLQSGSQLSTDEALGFYETEVGVSKKDTIKGVFENCNFENARYLAFARDCPIRDHIPRTRQ